MNIVMNRKLRIRILLKCLFVLWLSTTPTIVTGGESADGPPRGIELQTAVRMALSVDPWLVGNRHTQEAVEALSVSAGELPDPKISVGLANLPADTFDFRQEGMTQAKIGISQMFPRGSSRAIKRKQLEVLGGQYPYQRHDRQARVVTTVSRLWLDAYKAQESIVLIEKDRALFEQLADVAQASYSSAAGRTRQQDIVRADLELTRLKDRLTVLRQQHEMLQERLFEWLGSYSSGHYLDDFSVDKMPPSSGIQFHRALPDIKLIHPDLYKPLSQPSPKKLANKLSTHPAILALDKKIRAAELGVDLAKQKYKPEWSINASYGYRDDDLLGRDRADLFSFGVSFDAPIFTSNRQDKQLSAAVSQAEAIKTEKWLLLRKMISSLEAEKAQLARLNQRQQLYRSELLPQMYMQAEASLTAYTNDDGDFAEAVRARIEVLNTEIEALGIEVDRQKAIIGLNYLSINEHNAVEMMLNTGAESSARKNK